MKILRLEATWPSLQLVCSEQGGKGSRLGQKHRQEYTAHVAMVRRVERLQVG